MDASHLSKVLEREVIPTSKTIKSLLSRLDLSVDLANKFINSVGDEKKCKFVDAIDEKVSECD